MRTPLLAALLHSDSALPSGSFAFSWGLEELYEDELIGEDVPFESILEWYLTTRWAPFDRYFVHHSCLASADERVALDRRCTAASTAAAARMSGVSAGRAMLLSWSRMGMPPAEEFSRRIRSGAADGNLPVVQGLVYAESGMDQDLASAVSGWTCVSSLASAAVRMGRVGALASQLALSRTLDVLAALLDTPVPPRPTSWAVLQDVAMERHALRNSRLFAS
ncbi:urease accessory protein UreF [Agromyces aerolatus]|uniref:urease accessory protein UreF n=1 Tax=Agromyces sp. LY-1074 TaxID=3074080 RepID=UPI0028595CAA|nr:MULTISPECIES: urease accessory UreF family protein [unclassified Agromyces]MDR5700884.1 urease accessory UreF family protein [Agromyces sp. LY-1074]MDR5707455.1 urease accessory UreF family protein [Agromyces sp. LY-1358]